MSKEMSARAYYAQGPAPQARFELVDRDSPSRPAVEERIRRGFARHFGARISAFMPYLLNYEDAMVTGVLGFRPAAEEPLYLEAYLERPVEQLIGNLVRSPVSRADIVEVGQFVIDDPAGAAAMFNRLVPLLRDRGHAWIAFTATRSIRRLLEGAGLRGLVIATASEDCVRRAPDAWGSYYARQPQVVVGKLNDPGGAWCAARRNCGRVLVAVD